MIDSLPYIYWFCSSSLLREPLRECVSVLSGTPFRLLDRACSRGPALGGLEPGGDSSAGPAKGRAARGERSKPA
jgi:hypothetical protein